MIPCYAEWGCRPFQDSFGRLWLARKGTKIEGGYKGAKKGTGSLEDIRLPEGIYGCRVSARWRSGQGADQGYVAFRIEDYSRYVVGSYTRDGGKGGQFRGDLVPGTKVDDPELVQEFYKTEARRTLEFQLHGGAAGKGLAAGAGGEMRIRDAGTLIGASFSVIAVGGGVGVGLSLPSDTEWKHVSLPRPLKLCDFESAKVKMKSRAVRLVGGYSTLTITLTLTAGDVVEMNWSGFGFEWGAELDASTTMVGKLLRHSWLTPTFKYG
ncbi:MAG TPA: hypothetical protein VNE39_21215 [Planctomycetota bacterium]|nr:hypothetical protein [Planctomycetota bacterium]